MAERYLFFNSSQNDVREYSAEDFAWYFSNILKSGLIHNDGVPELDVKCDGNDLRTYLVPGRAIIGGHAYENTSDLYLEHGLPEATLDRIDRIVLRLDKRNQSRWIRAFVKQGEPSSNPVPPTLQRDEFIHELSLAQIRVRANTSALNPADLIDERLDGELCGLVSIQDTGFVRLEDFNTAMTEDVVLKTEKGQANGIATLDPNGNVPKEELGNAELKIEKGYFSNTTTTISAGTVYTKTIPLTTKAKQGRVSAIGYNNAPSYSFFNTYRFDTYVVSTGDNISSPIFRVKTDADAILSTGIFDSQVNDRNIVLFDVYINSDTNSLVVSFKNVSESNRTLVLNQLFWEVIG